MDTNSQVIVVGAGIGGLTLALACAQQGFVVTVCEQSCAIKEVGAGLQMSPNAMKVLDALGVAAILKASAFVPEQASIRDYQSGHYYLQLPLGDEVVSRYGAPYWHVHRADLLKALLSCCQRLGVEVILSAKLVDYQETTTEVVAQFEDGRELRSKLLVGADGIHSKLCERMFGAQPAKFTGQVAWRGVVPVERLGNVHVAPDACVWAGPGRHLVSYFLDGGKLVNFVAVEERQDWRNESWSEEGDVKALRKAFSGWHPDVSGLLEQVDQTFLWALYGRKPLDNWYKGRCVLLGDACHPMLPFMAQGAAMAIEDGMALARHLAKDKNQRNPTEAFAQYEVERKQRTTKIQTMSANNASLYHMSGPLGLAKLKVLSQLSRFAPSLVQGKLDPVYGYVSV
ncbi:FAD-dependent monooxygenase [Marinomonas epiphytica]